MNSDLSKIAVPKPTQNLVKGTIKINYDVENNTQVKSLDIVCPYCGKLQNYTLNPENIPHWRVVSEIGEPLSLRPSLYHDPLMGGCGLRGWLEKGKFLHQLVEGM